MFPLIAMIGANVAGGLIGNAASAGDRAAAVASNKAALQEWLDINVPDPAAQKVVLQKFVQTGEIDPQLETAIKRDPSSFENIRVDPKLKQTRLRALDSLSDIGEGGLTLQDKADLERATNEINVMDRGKRDSIVDSFARRGQSGSGLALAAQIQGAQGAVNRQSQNQLDTLASARKRALDAIVAGGNLAGDISDDDYKQQSDLASARDTIADFNTRNMQSIQQRNADRRNAANEYNLNLKQKISDANTKLSNDEQIYNKELLQKEFENKAKKAQGVAGQYGKMAEQSTADANRTAGQWAGIGSAVGKGALAYGMYEPKQEQPLSFSMNEGLDSSNDDEEKKKFWESLA